MKSLERKPRKLMLEMEGLSVDTFPTMPFEIPQLGAATISNCTRCPSHPDSLCPCCTGPYLCP